MSAKDPFNFFRLPRDMPRFYCPDARFVLHENCVLPEKARHHAGRVLRMKAGETAVLFDGRGLEASGPIAFEGKDRDVELGGVFWAKFDRMQPAK